jgi:hypothetical protein
VVQTKPTNVIGQAPYPSLRHCLAMLPDDVVKCTVLNATTQMHMSVENENQGEPRKHYQSLCPRF